MSALPLVPRQPPVAPLNAAARQALACLGQQQKNTKRLAHHLKQAADQLAVVAGQLNYRGIDYSAEQGKKRRRAEVNGEEEDQQEKTAYEDFQRKLQDLTRTTDNGVRAIVDDQIWLDRLPEIMKQIACKAEAASQASQRQIQHTEGKDEDEDEAARPDSSPPPSAEEVPSVLLKAAREDLSTKWSSRTLTQRYSQNNTYVEFYRTVHDSKNPGEDAPPLPHPSLWFANEEDVNPSYVAPGTQQQTQRHRRPGRPSDEADGAASEASFSDIEIAREKISIKCPITLVPFKSPVTSIKCPHSFDKAGITAMLQRTTISLPLTDAQMAEIKQIRDSRGKARKTAEFHIPAIPCPVCSTLLTEADLHPDPVLLRKVHRIQAAEAREREAATSDLDGGSDDSDDEDGIIVPGKGTQRKPVGLGSSPPPPSVRAGKKKSALDIKRERARSKSRGISMVPQTQLGEEGDEEIEDEVN